MLPSINDGNARYRSLALTPAGSNSFSGRQVVEADGGGTTDGCHYKGAGVPDEVTDMTSGGSWSVDSNNTWHDDTIGWGRTPSISTRRVRKQSRVMPRDTS